MAKSKLPSVDDDFEPRQEPPARAASATAESPAEVTMSVDEGYLPRRVDAKLTRAQATVLRDKLRALQDSGAKTADGRFVGNRTQAIQWILENEVAKQ
jgi:hypothetical protein